MEEQIVLNLSTMFILLIEIIMNWLPLQEKEDVVILPLLETKLHMRIKINDRDFVLSAGGKVTNAQRVHIAEMFQLKQGSQLNAAIVV
jgi:hypothetical protein